MPPTTATRSSTRDIRAHPAQFIHMAVTVFKHGLHEQAGSPALHRAAMTTGWASVGNPG